MSPTQTSPSVVNVEQLYNMLMNEIEPELTTDMLPLLDELYKDELPADTEARGAWYAEAFEIFDREYGQLVNGWKNFSLELQKKATALGRKVQEQGQHDDTGSIENSIQHS